ncbi:hypothetical protein AVEN_188541-1 [Araneus ventricosus]|uniref:Uncharacterized protein n=1 Tax=Araneus ventricosus TaxID=182803 RepID=A0A4Y2SE88_ARAVE|nr:hypothetical protein AVEN_188541-1 [Araneus ventricosus]
MMILILPTALLLIPRTLVGMVILQWYSLAVHGMQIEDMGCAYPNSKCQFLSRDEAFVSRLLYLSTKPLLAGYPGQENLGLDLLDLL